MPKIFIPLNIIVRVFSKIILSVYLFNSLASFLQRFFSKSNKHNYYIMTNRKIVSQKSG